MPKPQLQTKATVKTTEEIKLAPKLEKQLRQRLTNYASLKQELDSLKAALDDEKAAIGALREKTGHTSVSLDGYTVTQVTGTTSKLDKKKLIQLGCAAAWIEEATVVTPKKPYELISLPGEKGGNDE